MTFADVISLLKGDTQAERVVPKRGIVATLTVLTAGVMAFVAVFVIALSLGTRQIATDWIADLSETATLRLPAASTEEQVTAVLALLEGSAGVASARVLDEAEQQALLAPWFGPDVPVEALPLPVLVEIKPSEGGYSATQLTEQIEATAPGAALDDHGGWSTPLATAANRLRWLSWVVLALISAAVIGMVTLAATAALAANAQVISVLRLVGATDAYITRAFVRRFTLRALAGGAIGTALGYGATLLIPSVQLGGLTWTGVGLSGGAMLWLVLLPIGCGIAAFWATRHATLQRLKEIP